MADSIHVEALDQAVTYAQKKYPGFRCSRDFLESLIRTMLNKKERLDFTEAMRFTLNEHHLWDRGIKDKRRTWYKSAVAKYFSINASIVVAAARRAGRTESSKNLSARAPIPPVRVIEKPDGQLGWEI